MGRGGTLRGLPDPSGTFRRLPDTIAKKWTFSQNPDNNFPYINLYLWTILEILMIDPILDSKQPLDFPLLISQYYPSANER